MVDLTRGNVIWVDLGPIETAESGEQSGVRPCVIVSKNSLNYSNHPCVIICPISGQEHMHREYPTHVTISAGVAGMIKDSVIMAEQVKVISKARIDTSEEASVLPQRLMRGVDRALMNSLRL